MPRLSRKRQEKMSRCISSALKTLTEEERTVHLNRAPMLGMMVICRSQVHFECRTVRCTERCLHQAMFLKFVSLFCCDANCMRRLAGCKLTHIATFSFCFVVTSVVQNIIKFYFSQRLCERSVCKTQTAHCRM